MRHLFFAKCDSFEYKKTPLKKTDTQIRSSMRFLKHTEAFNMLKMFNTAQRIFLENCSNFILHCQNKENVFSYKMFLFIWTCARSGHRFMWVSTINNVTKVFEILKHKRWTYKINCAGIVFFKCLWCVVVLQMWDCRANYDSVC